MSASGTVLIVEDEQALADLYATWLSSEYDVRTSYDGETALAQLDADVDCVLLDRRMPGLSGDEVLETIRERDLTCPVAMVTAVEPDFDIVEMGFNDYIEKPVSRSDLLTLVDELLSLTSYEDVIQQYYQLASKKAALEATKSDAELAASEEYTRLKAKFQRVQQEADDQFENLGDRGEFSQLL